MGLSSYKLEWCTDLQNQVGGFTGYEGEERTVSVVKDGSDLLINISLVVDGGSDGENLVQSYFSRRLRKGCLLYTSPSPRDRTRSRMPSSA